MPAVSVLVHIHVLLITSVIRYPMKNLTQQCLAEFFSGWMSVSYLLRPLSPNHGLFEQMDFPQAHPPHFLTLFRNSVSSLSTLSSCIRSYGSKPLSLSAKLQCTIHRYKPCTIVGETPTKVNMSLLSIFNF